MANLVHITVFVAFLSLGACSPEVSPGKSRVDPPFDQTEPYSKADAEERLRQIKVENASNSLLNLKNDIDAARATGKPKEEQILALDYRVQEQRAKIETLILELAAFRDQDSNLEILRNQVYVLRTEVENMKVQLAVDKASASTAPVKK